MYVAGRSSYYAAGTALTFCVLPCEIIVFILRPSQGSEFNFGDSCTAVEFKTRRKFNIRSSILGS